MLLYDDASASFVSEVTGVGSQPYDIAVERCAGNAARLFVSVFDDGKVAVIDIPDLNVPERANLVAYLGRPQSCITNGGGSECQQ